MSTTVKRNEYGLISTPPLPEELPSVVLSDNAKQVLLKRYVRRGEDSKPCETVEGMFWRVAYNVAAIEEKFQADVMERAIEYYHLLGGIKFFPNSPTFTGAGTPLGQLAACFVLPIADDMGKSEIGIFSTLRNAALIQQTGGGNGFAFSRLRPKGTLVKSSAGRATGPVGFLNVYDHAFGEVAQGGSRRGANMAVLRVDHPDIEEFITCKTNEYSVTNFNISVGVTDAFMKAVEADEDWELKFPDVAFPLYRGFDGTLEQVQKAGLPIKTYKTVRARQLFELIVKQAHHNGEPGLLFLDAANRSNPVSDQYDLEATNPCGEQWLGPFESCCLGSINLAQHFAPDHQVDWEAVRKSTVMATRFLDDVVDANQYVPSVPQLKEAAQKNRRIGLGIMGLADLMYHVGVRYGSTQGQEFASQVMEFVRYHSMVTSIELAKERGSFPGIEKSIYSKENFRWQPPQPIFEYSHDWGRPALDWDQIRESILTNGIRNAAQTTIAPTGTIATVAGCEGYGCEPVFALAYIRHVNDNGKDLALSYCSPLFEKALDEANISGDAREEIMEQVMNEGSCQKVDLVPENIRDIFVVSMDVTAEEHVRMQAAMQAFVDNSLSKTINFPEDATVNDVALAYKLAWELGCKGITVYVTNSRETVVLETKSVAEKKAEPEPTGVYQPPIWPDTKKPRPRSLPGYTYTVETPLGKAFITINENGGQQPFEVFINTAKAGSDTASVSEAIGRLISYVLRISSPILPRQRMKEVITQLLGIGGGRSLGFGPNRVRSLPDGIGQVLSEYLTSREQEMMSQEPERKNGKHISMTLSPDTFSAPILESETHSSMKIGDLCPECGQASVVNEEGCRKCYSCGYSEC